MEQRTPEWHEARKGRITASAVGAILGHSPLATRDDIMRRMVRDWHGAEPEFIGNVATEYGTFHEEGALFEYQMETENGVSPCGFIAREEWAGCSPDGLVGLTGGVEIKCPFGKRNMTAEETFKPLAEQEHYYDQIQFSLWVAQRAWWDFFQWSPVKTSLERVEPCSKWRSKNLPKLKKFREEYLHEREQNAKVHLESLRVVIDTPESARLVAEYDELSVAIERAKERQDDIKASLVALAKERNALVSGRNLTRVERAGSVAYAKAVKDHLPELDLEPYRGKPTTYWKF